MSSVKVVLILLVLVLAACAESVHGTRHVRVAVHIVSIIEQDACVQGAEPHPVLNLHVQDAGCSRILLEQDRAQHFWWAMLCCHKVACRKNLQTAEACAIKYLSSRKL